MNRLPLLTMALVLTAAASFPAAQAQTPKKPAPTTVPAPVVAPAPKPAPADPLAGVRVHLAALRSLPLTQPQVVLQVPREVPPTLRAGSPAYLSGVYQPSTSSMCFR